MSDDKVLVTGSTGLVGAHILLELLKNKQKVKALKRANSDTAYLKKILALYKPDADGLFDKIEWADGDINDRVSLDKAFEGVDKVYHAAAIVSFDPASAPTMRKINVEGTANIVALCLKHRIKKLCHVSSVAAVGRAGSKGHVNEETPWDATAAKSVYAQTKYDAEKEVWKGIEKGLCAVMVNPSIIIGPGLWEKGSAKLFTTVWEGIKFYTTGINGFVDVRDVAKIMFMLMESGVHSERFIINSENKAYKDVFFAIADNLKTKRPPFYAGLFLSALAWRAAHLQYKLTGKAPLITKETARTAQSKYHYDNSKICKLLNYSFISIDNSIADTAKVFLNDRYHTQKQ